MSELSGVLLVCDFDNTIASTKESLQRGLPFPGVPEENRAAILRFMEQGGRFSVVTGRAFPAYRDIRPLVPTNCPTGLFNGAALYDYEKGEYVYRNGVSERFYAYCREVLDAFPTLGMEIFMWDERVYAVRPNDFVVRHQQFTRAPWVEVPSAEAIGELPAKMLFEDDEETLARVGAFIRSRPWYGDTEAIFSTRNLLEFTARGAHKGGAVLALCSLLGIEKKHLYCAGDEQNDLAMLLEAEEGFIPADANPCLLDRGFTVVRPPSEGSIADIVARLEKKYG